MSLDRATPEVIAVVRRKDFGLDFGLHVRMSHFSCCVLVEAVGLLLAFFVFLKSAIALPLLEPYQNVNDS